MIWLYQIDHNIIAFIWIRNYSYFITPNTWLIFFAAFLVLAFFCETQKNYSIAFCMRFWVRFCVRLRTRRSELAFKDSQLFGHDSSNYIIFRKRFHVENRRKWFIDCSFSRHFHFACCAQLKTARWLDLKITKHFLAKLFAFWSHCENCWQRLRNGLVGTHAIFFHTAVEWTSLIMGLPVSPHSINYNPSGTRKHSP